MGIQAQNIVIAFRSIQPEQLHMCLQQRASYNHKNDAISSHNISESIFQSLAYTQYPTYSHEEIANIYNILCEQMESPDKRHPGDLSVFNLLVRMGQRVLLWKLHDAPSCEFSKLFSWRNVYQNLGQDIVTTAYLAYEDIRRGGFTRQDFDWVPILRTNNKRLNLLLSKGLAENHCHLGGTTQNFPVTWACLMNHVEAIKGVSTWLNLNLQPQLSRGASSNVWPWEKRLIWAAWLRLRLFKRLAGLDGSVSNYSLFDLDRSFHPIVELKKEITSVRFLFGARVKVPASKPDVLDYALRISDCQNGLFQSTNRLLSGERSFLYRCFRACFDGTFDSELQDWFYMYLLIKSNFRAEIVQVNQQVGFYNFMEYQNRKDMAFDKFPAYKAEAIRLSINANQTYQSIQSFEVRIGPRNTPADLHLQIRKNEDYVKAGGAIREDCHLFYVYHFIKTPDNAFSNKERPRNIGVRNASRVTAQALAYSLQHNQYLNERVLGIDAANLEIGCRPEVFAIAFRYLRALPPSNRKLGFHTKQLFPKVHVTYHAGEDFLDIADGLRAIDEAIHFLKMERGDRIGHALALGIDPKLHYTFKRNRVILPKQDLLDNLVWLKFRAHELNIPMSEDQLSVLQYKAEELFYEIYGSFFQQIYPGRTANESLHEYYCSMQLRGDDPELYFKLPFREVTSFMTNSWNDYRLCPDSKLSIYRQLDSIAYLYHAYHFDKGVRERGEKTEIFVIKPAYISLIHDMQDRLAEKLAEKGIMIECNPTSNYLIGTFKRYDQHPIIRFNNFGLIRRDGTYVPSPQLSVSINTDDLGVFDTSLENEYAMLAAALLYAKEDGSPIYASESIYKYLDNIREMGLEQSFGI